MYTFSIRDVFGVIAKLENHEVVNYYLLWCTAERIELYDPKESDEM